MTSEFNPAGEWDDNFTEYPSGSQKNQPDRSTPTKDCKICTNPSKNVFFDKHHVFLHPISIRLAKFTFKQSAVPNQSLVEYTIPDSVPKSLPLWYSLSQPMAFAIELTQLVEKRPKHVLKSNLNNSAFLVIWPDLTTASDESNDGRCFARLQVALSRDCREVRKSPFGDVTPTFLTESFSLQSLIQQATEAVSRIPGSAINWNACQKYGNYELESEPDYPAEATEPEDRETAKLNQQFTNLSVALPSDGQKCAPLPNCCLGAHLNLKESVELCVNEHRACMGCIRMHVENQLRAVCCGNTEAEVHWTCPYPECSAPLSRLAQLQSCPLEDLLPVWKCADFFDQIRLRIVQRGGKQPRFYANPEAYPEAVLSVWSGPMHVFPSRSVEIFLRPAAVSVRFWPRLYYSPTGCTCEIHWPASCQAVGKYYRMRNAFGDSKCVISSAIPNYDGMQPLELPMPEGGRSKFYVNALRVAWRRNVIWKRHFSQKRVWTEFHYVDDINGRTIDEDKFIGWLETLIEMQTILEFLYVQMEFGSTGTEHNSYIAIMRRMELSMGRNLGIYPICRIITGNPRKDVKYTSKPVRRLALRVLNQRALSFELFRPRLLNVGNTS